MLIVPLLLIQNGQDAAASPSSGPSTGSSRVASGGRHGPARPVPHTELVSSTRADPARKTTPATGTARRGKNPPKARKARQARAAQLIAQADAADRFPTRSAHRPGSGPTVPAPVEVTAPAEVVVDRRAPVIAAPPAPVPAPTTTTAPPPADPPPATTEEGQVTYYDHPAGTCASPWLPFGTVVEVTNPANGESVSCVVNDREADTARAIDLATATFAQIAPLSQGVIDAELSW